MSEFSVVPELRIGSIVEVSGAAIRIELDDAIAELTRTYGGRVYPIGQFASIVKVHFGRRILVAYVNLLRMRSEIAREEGLPIPSNNEDSRILEADLFGEVLWSAKEESGEFVRGVRNYPLPGQSAYLTTQEELKCIYEGKKGEEDEPSPVFPIGSYVGAKGLRCFANMDKLFGLHCAVLGSTGAGKSASVAAIIHSILEHEPTGGDDKLRPRTIIIDPHGEYEYAFGNKAIVYRAYDLGDPGGEEGNKLRLPYWLMSGEEFRDLVVGKTEYEATSENNIVYKALWHSRLVTRGWIEQARTWEGEEVAAGDLPESPRPKDDELEELIGRYDRDTPDPFSLDELESHIANEQAMRIKSGKWERKAPSDYKSYASVLNKLEVLRNDPRLSFMMSEHSEGDPDLPEILQQFVGKQVGEEGDEVDLRIIDISGLPNEVAGPLTAALARLLFQYKVWQSRSERERDPILLICEEAHRYVPASGLAQYQSAQSSIRRIAKEGRKYGIGLMLVTQRPSDVEQTVLSQCNSWIVLRLSNSKDQAHVASVLPDNLSGLANILPSLSRREALFVGEASSVPARIILRELNKDQLPRSDDVSFVAGWSNHPADIEEIATVVSRWRNERE